MGTIERGQERIRLFILRETGQSIRFVSTCCHSTLLVHHPFYQNNLVMVLSQGAKLNVPIIEKKMRVTMKDFPKDKIDQLKPFLGNPVDREKLDDFGANKAGEEFNEFIDVTKEKKENPAGTNTQAFIESSHIDVLGLENYKELI